MKKLFSAIILCTAILCGCSEKGENGISETDIPETSSVTVAAESSAVTSAKTETAAAKETTVTEPAEEEIILTPIPSDEPLEVMECKIIEDIAIDNEEDFPDKEVIKRAREICFADGEIYKIITEENNSFAEEEYGENADIYKSETAEDISFICGLEYDFDGDGENEYVISLQYYSTPIGMGGALVVYMDGDKHKILETGGNPVDSEQIKIITAGGYDFLMLFTSAGFLWYSEDIYSFESGMPEKAFYCDEANGITFQNGVFYYELKYGGTYPFILCGDGKFRQLGRERISREDFEKHVQNDGEYIGSLAKKGDEVTEIYTYGYYKYELYGEDFRYNVYYVNNDFHAMRYGCDGVSEEFRFTDEVVYGDVWAVKPV